MKDDDQILAWERVAALLSSEEVTTSEEIRSDLEAEGINVAQSVESLRTMIRRRYQAQLRETAQAGRATALRKLQVTVAEVAAWPIERLRQWLGEAEAGNFGADVAGMTLAFHRNKEGKEPTEAELRSLVSDIISAKK